MEQQNRWTGAASQPYDSNSPPDAAAGLVAAKADLGKRCVAVLIDAGLAFVVGLIPLIGGLIAAAYWVVRDGLELEFMDRRSIGKKLMKLRPVRLDGASMDVATSMRRNWMFAIGGLVSVLLYIPIIGWLLMVPVALLAVAIGLFEIFKVVTDDRGRRLGDSMAGTVIVESDR